jgi:predicted metal-dependent peptidase
MNPIHEEQRQAEARETICMDILKNARNELYLQMRFLDSALSRLIPLASGSVSPAGTEGSSLYFEPEALIELYKEKRILVNRLYLHTVLHCLFSHLWKPQPQNVDIWNLSCDMAMEYVLDHLYQSCIHLSPNALRGQVYREMKSELPVITAEKIYLWLTTSNLKEERFESLVREFRVDDHRLWGEAQKKTQKQEIENSWKQAREQMQTEMETISKEASEESEALADLLRVENRERYNYRDFLKKFSVLKEEMQVDPDSFDYIFYHYGMEMYGNMPLIEPLETREIRKVEDFVIVIDTSMSCKGELVQKFLEETYTILASSESMSRQMRIHIIQCDEEVRSDQVIVNSDELKEYMEHLEVRGMGGTDFRPAFAYVEELLAKKAFGKLRGMIYFTDGYGIFPAKKPVYDTAFVFMKEDYQDLNVPPWAIKLILDPDEIGADV